MKANSSDRSCPDLAALAAFVLRQLPADTQQMVAGHLASCPHCEAALRTLEAPAPASATMRADLVNALTDEPGYKRLDSAVKGMPPRRQSRAAPVRLPGFTVLGEIGRGTIGVVYRARQLHPERLVAVKVIPAYQASDPAQRRRFRHSVSQAAGLRGSRVVPLLDVLLADHCLALVMPYFAGGDLENIIQARRRLRDSRMRYDRHPAATREDGEYLERMIPLLDQLLDSVAVIHAAHGRYRDLKPSNCLLDSQGRLWLGDYGYSSLVDRGANVLVAEGNEGGPEHVEMRQPPSLRVHAPVSITPEQWAGQSDLDCRTDVFRLGVTLYQALTLEWPFGLGPVTLETPLPAPVSRLQPLLTPELDGILCRALAPDRARRYRSASELRAAWQRVGHKIVATKRLPRPAPRRRWSSHLKVIACGVVAVAAALALAFYW
jgi:serine/threonine protein kinase